jgi:uncharacterized protein YceK
MKSIFLIMAITFILSGCARNISTSYGISENIEIIKKNYKKFFSSENNATQGDKNATK